jgi:hypothetical protein
MALIPGARYPAQTDVAAAYPQGKARNAVTFQDGSGTPLERDWLNDLWGFLQSLLATAAITPSGSPDEVGASQYLAAVQAIANASAAASFARLDLALLQLRLIDDANPYADTAASLGIARQSNGTLIIVKSGASDVHRFSESDDSGQGGIGTITSITSLVTDIAITTGRTVVIGTGGNRCCFSTNFGTSWSAGSDLGATPDRIIYNSPQSRFMASFAAGVNVAQDVDAASTWTNAATTLNSAQGGLANFSNGDTLACGLDGSSAVAISRSTNGGTSWAVAPTVPNPSDYADSGWIDGNGGATIWHAGALTASPGNVRICSTDSTLNWQLLSTISFGVTPTGKARILVDNFFSVLVCLVPFSSGTVAVVSRDGGLTWSSRAFYKIRALNSFGLAQGRLFSSVSGELYSTMQLGT